MISVVGELQLRILKREVDKDNFETKGIGTFEISEAGNYNLQLFLKLREGYESNYKINDVSAVVHFPKGKIYNTICMTVTIPQKLTQGQELIVIPLAEYEALVELKKIYEFQPNTAQKKALIDARKNRRRGKVITLHELKHKLGFRG